MKINRALGCGKTKPIFIVQRSAFRVQRQEQEMLFEKIKTNSPVEIYSEIGLLRLDNNNEVIVPPGDVELADINEPRYDGPAVVVTSLPKFDNSMDSCNFRLDLLL